MSALPSVGRARARRPEDVRRRAGAVRRAAVGLVPFAALVVAAAPASAHGAPVGAPPPAAPEPVSVPDPLPLAWCLARAEKHNPSLAAARADADAARERVVVAGALDDPRLRYEASNLPAGDLDFRSTPLSGHQIGLAQHFPFPGVLGSAEDAARSGARASEWQLADRRHRVASAVQNAWAELRFAQRAREITADNVGLLRRLTRTAEARYRVGEGLQQDVLRAQVELTSLLDEQLKREAALRRAEARLAALLDLPASTALPAAADAAPPPVPELPALLEALPDTSPLLRAWAAHVEEREHGERAARLRGYPDFDLSLGYRVRRDVPGDPVDGDDFLTAGITIRLPVNRGRWRAEAAEQSALARRAGAHRRAAHLGLEEAIRSAHADLARADAEVALLDRGLLPQARQSLEASRSGYEVGRVDFLDVLDSQVRLFEAELRRARALADRRAAFAALEASVGEELP